MKTRKIDNRLSYFKRKNKLHLLFRDNNEAIFPGNELSKTIKVVPALMALMVFLDWLLVLAQILFKMFDSEKLPAHLYINSIVLVVCFLLSAFSLLVFQSGTTKLYKLARYISILTLVGALLYLTEQFLGNSLFQIQTGLKQAQQHFYMGFVSINTALGFVLLNLSLILSSAKIKNGSFISQLLALNLVLISFLWLIGHLFSTQTLYSNELSVFTAYNNAACFVLLGVGSFVIRPEKGMHAVLLKHGFGGIIMRRLFPLVLLIPVLFVWFQNIDFQHNFLNTSILGIALIVTSLISIYIYSLWSMANEVNKLELEYQNATSKITNANERFSLAVEAAGFGIWDYKAQTGEVIWDDKMYEIYGAEKSSTEDITALWRQAFHPEDLEYGEKDVATALNDGLPYDCEYRILRPDGQTRYLRAIGKVIFDSKENPIRMTGLTLDQTDFKRAQKEMIENEQKYKYLFHENPVPIWIFDEERMEFLEVNHAAVEHYGYSEKEFMEMSYLDIRPKGDVPLLKKMLKTGMVSKHRGTWRHLKKNGEIIYADVKAHQIKYEERKARIVISNDVTLQKLAADQMQLLNDELEERVSKRTKQLQNSNRDLESFAYSVSHDLRAPLRHIIGFSQKLERHLHDIDSSSETNRLIKKIKDSASKLGELIDELLTFSRLGRSNVNKTLVYIGRVVQEVLNEYTIQYDEAKVEWVIEELPEVEADAILLKSVFQNLINNALKFSRNKEKIRIEIGCKEEKKEYVFFIKDNGAGFNMEYAGKLFGVFQRLHSNEEFEGIGIGLAIVQRIINKHNGQIWAEGEENIGATFYFSLPK